MEQCTQCKAKIRYFPPSSKYVPSGNIENGRKSCVSGRWLLHRKTKRSVRFYFIASWIHSHSAHSRDFEQSFLVTGEHGFVEPEALGSSVNGRLNSCISNLRPV